jgi:Dolichyl-phosphate-mannose-protein mannosyltransferase
MNKMKPNGDTRFVFYFLLLLALGLRLYGVTNPLTDHHYWRQTDTAAIARNFATIEMNIMQPMLDWQGERGYAEVEFQLYTFLIAVLYKVVGVHDSLGRMLSVLFSMVGWFVLYDMARRMFGRSAALGAVALYSIAPLAVFFGRSFQPEAAMATFSIFALYAAWRYSERESIKWLWLSAVSVSLAILLKLTSLYLGLPLLFIAYRRDRFRFLLCWKWWVFAFIALAPSYYWYTWAHQLGVASGAGFSILGTEGTHRLFPLHIILTGNFFHMLAQRYLFDATALLGVPLVAWGVYCLLKKREQAWLFAWLFGFLVFQLGAALGHLTHDYYSLPVVFALAVFFGYGLNNLIKRYRLSSVVVPAIATLMAALSMFYMHRETDPWYGEIYAMRAEALQLGEIVPHGQLVVINDDLEHVPEPFYFSGLRGWHETNFIEWQDDLRHWIERRKNDGAAYYAAFLEAEGHNPFFFMNQHPTGRYIARRYEVVHADAKLVVADLNKPRNASAIMQRIPSDAVVSWQGNSAVLHPPVEWTQTSVDDSPEYILFDLFDAASLQKPSSPIMKVLQSGQYGLTDHCDGLVVLRKSAASHHNADVLYTLQHTELYEVGRLPCYTGQPCFDLESPLMYGWEARCATSEFQDLGVLRRHDLLPGRYTATYFVRCASPGLEDLVAGVVFQTQPDRTLLAGENFSGVEWESATDYKRLSYTCEYLGGASPEIVLQFRDKSDLLAHSLLFYPALPELDPINLLRARHIKPIKGRGLQNGVLRGVGKGKREGLLFEETLLLPAGRFRIDVPLASYDTTYKGVVGYIELLELDTANSDEDKRVLKRITKKAVGQQDGMDIEIKTPGTYYLRYWDYGQVSLEITGMRVATAGMIAAGG